MKLHYFASPARGPTVFMAPNDDFGADDDAFVERPGDREPEPEPANHAGEDDAETEADTEGGEEPESEDGGADLEPEAEDHGAVSADDHDTGEEEEEERPRKRDWKDRQLEKRARQLQEAEARVRAAEERNAALEALLQKPVEERTVDDEALLTQAEKRVEARLRQEQYVDRINKAADNMFDAGMKAFPNTWAESVARVGEVYGEQIAKRPDFLEAVTDLENGAAVYHHLSDDPERLEAILAMPPHKMGIELAKLSNQVGAPKPKPVSKAPAPIKPLDRPVSVDRPLEDLLNDPNASMEEIDRKMRAAEEARHKARRR